jgi:cytochrome c biogenesis protein CcmG/thiol:disulfide interchange protein DsbE
MKLRFLLPIAVFAVLVPLLIFGLSRDPSRVPSPLIGKPAPQFELPEVLDPGRRVGSADYAGRMALVNVWATWCAGCREEHDFLLTLAEREEIPIYGLNWRDERTAAARWLSEFGNPYVASGFDRDGSVGIDWGVYGAPETFLIGPDGTVLHKHVSPLTEQVWQRDFVPLIHPAKGAR